MFITKRNAILFIVINIIIAISSNNIFNIIELYRNIVSKQYNNNLETKSRLIIIILSLIKLD